jgi:hypothetical protein
MRKASYAMATPCSRDAPGSMGLAAHPGNRNKASKELADMGRMGSNERVPHRLALAMPDSRVGVNKR